MFGFSYLSQNTIGNLLSGQPLFPKELLNDLFAFDTDTELNGATLIDTHQYTEKGITYAQKVYRLKDNTIYVETNTVVDTEAAILKCQLEIAIESQNFEEAVILRDKINSLKTN